ncbi:MAG: Flp pilus assembly protein CpaB [Acidimicrobiia bacterium]|nr:Flp pilus assembly protein CpaB [Acidimicrobiia bacterium]
MGRRTLVLVVALLLAAIATFAVYNFLSGVEEEAAKDRTYQVVYRALEVLPEGTTGAAVIEQFRYVESEEEARLVPQNAIDSIEKLEATLAGRVAAGPISGGQVLTTDQWVAITTEIAPLAGRIADGKEAITVSVALEQGVNGFIEPGDRVNVIVSMELEIDVPIGEEVIIGDVQPEEPAPADGQPVETNTITKAFTRYTLQGVPVLAVGKDVKPEEDAPAEVVVPQTTEDGAVTVPEEESSVVVLTLEVSPDQAEKLVFGRENGSTWLTLVPPGFVAVSDQPTEGVTVEALYGPEFGYLTKLFPFLADLEALLLEE